MHHSNSGIRDTAGQDEVLAPRGSGKRKRLLIASAIGLALAATLVYPAYERWSAAEISTPLARLRLGTASTGLFERDAAVQGKIVAANSPTLYSNTPGLITLHVRAGDAVKIGDTLAEIDSPELKNELAREAATLQSMENEAGRARIDGKQKVFEAQRQVDIAAVALTAAEREKRRADDERTQLALSKIEREKITDELEKARITHANAERQVALAEENQNYEIRTKENLVTRQRLVVENLQRRVDALTLRSPVNGMVGSIPVPQKSAITPNMPLMTVVDLGAYAAELDVPESYADDLGIGMNVDIAINGKNHSGVLTAISPEVKNNLVQARVQWQGETPAGLRQNQRISARILFERRENVLTVPRGPFLESSGGRVVYVVKDGIAEKRAVTTGATSVGAVEIIDGLQPGEQIIISSTTDFKDASSVLLTN